MTEASQGASAPISDPPARRRREHRKRGSEASVPVRHRHPMLEQLAALHPQLFGARCLPLKLGIYEDLLARHGDALAPDELKIALGQHARSTRYLDCIASGLARHDLDGQPVEPVAPEHRHHAILEVFRRRQGAPNALRNRMDPRERALRRLVETIEASGLSHAEYLARTPTRDTACAVLVEEALLETGRRAAQGEALLRAFEASGKREEEFAEMYGRPAVEVHATLERARRAKASS